jgi:phosphatidylserine/phosphatidylglycerophosphate/cardiolipin synthase-like enzyme
MPSAKGHMHHKFMVIDQEHVVTGSFNFVTKSFSGNFENLIAIKSRALAASFTGHWKSIRETVR